MFGGLRTQVAGVVTAGALALGGAANGAQEQQQAGPATGPTTKQVDPARSSLPQLDVENLAQVQASLRGNTASAGSSTATGAGSTTQAAQTPASDPRFDPRQTQMTPEQLRTLGQLTALYKSAGWNEGISEKVPSAFNPGDEKQYELLASRDDLIKRFFEQGGAPAQQQAVQAERSQLIDAVYDVAAQRLADNLFARGDAAARALQKLAQARYERPNRTDWLGVKNMFDKDFNPYEVDPNTGRLTAKSGWDAYVQPIRQFEDSALEELRRRLPADKRGLLPQGMGFVSANGIPDPTIRARLVEAYTEILLLEPKQIAMRIQDGGDGRQAGSLADQQNNGYLSGPANIVVQQIKDLAKVENSVQRANNR